MTPTEIQTLIDYNYWARDQLLEAIDRLSPEQFTRDMKNSFSSIRDTVAHLHGAEWIWYQRWIGESPTGQPPMDRFPDVASARAAWQEIEQQIRAYFAPLDQGALSRLIQYKSPAGISAAPLWQMLQHVVNHASYHRGQITTMLRQQGMAPPKSMDLMAFYRERATPAA